MNIEYLCPGRGAGTQRLVRGAFALGIVALGLLLSIPAYAQATHQCAAGNAQSPLASAANGGYFTSAPDVVRAQSATAPLTRFGTGANGAILVTGNMQWSEASPAINGDRTSITILINGTAYARFVSGQNVGGNGTSTGLNGATLLWNGGTTAPAGGSRAFTITLPLGVQQILGANALTVRYTDLDGVQGDDWNFNTINTLECVSRLAVTKATLGGAGRLGTEQFTVGAFGNNQTAASSYTTGGAGNAVTGGPGLVQWFDAGSPYTINETISANAGVYNTSLACTNAAAVATGTVLPGGSGTSFSLTPRAGDNITCTFTNTRISQSFRLAKTWVNGVAGHTASATTTGGSNNASFASTAPTNTTGTAVVVSAGNTVTLPAETFGGGASAAVYATTVACTGGTTLAASTPPQTITIANNATPTVCTYTNTARTTTLQLAKAWDAGSVAGNEVTIGATTGGTNNTASFNATAPTAATSGAAVVVTIGNTITLPAETGTNVGNYTTTLGCTGGHTLSGTNGQQANTLTITSTNAVLCTYTNAPRTATLQLAKTWATNAIAGHQVSIGATTGGTNNTASFNATAPTAATSGAAVVVTIGNTITLPAETGANVGDYTTAVACTGGHALSGTDGQQTNTLTITSPNAAVCTYTNTLSRVEADLSISKTNNATVVTAGGQTTYTVRVTNGGPSAADGAAVRDTPVAGLNGCQVTGCTGSGGGVCPAVPGGILGPSGTTVPVLPAGGALEFTVVCDVDN